MTVKIGVCLQPDTTGVHGALLTNTDGKKLDLPQVN
jgi:hypothetical protein